MQTGDGMRYEFPACVYPRYRYFREHLASLVPRFKRTIESAKLCHCISQGLVKFKEILTAAEEFSTKKVKITVFADDVTLISSLKSQLVQISEPDAEKQRSTIPKRGTIPKRSIGVPITWGHYQKEAHAMIHVVVYAITSQDSITWTTVKNKFSSLTEAQLRNMVIYNEKTGTSFLFTELEKAKFEVDWQISKDNKLLSRQIEHVLEDAVVEILERIVSYIGEFVPRAGVELDQSLLDEINSQVLKCTQEKHVVDDLSPEHQASLSDPQPMEEDSKPTKYQPLSESPMDEKLYRNLTNYLSNKTKCIICDHISKKYGIAPSLVNEFLNKDFHDYETKFKELMLSVTAPHWYQVQGDAVSKIKYFTTRCISNTSDIIHETENYIRRILVILDFLQKMEFEVFGLLRQAKVKTYVNIPKTPKLPLELQLELLDIPEVTGCGTIWGKLMLHVVKNLTPSTKEDIKFLLQVHRYSCGYSTELISERREHAGGLTFEHGNQIRAKLTQDGIEKLKKEYPEKEIGEYLLGSLGCFVKVRKNSNTASAVTAREKSKLHGITCAHCVKYCHKKVEVNVKNKFHEIGHYNGLHRYEPEVFDIAAIEILENKRSSCDLTLKSQQEMKYTEKWTFLEEDPAAGLSVYKMGCISNLTKGVISSNNYRTKSIKKLEEHYKAENKPFKMSEHYNILIQSEADIPAGTGLQDMAAAAVPPACEAFSEEGDSGSIVCCENLEDESVVAISILQGGVKKRNKFEYSYSSHLKRSLDKMGELHGCTIEPGWCCQNVGGGEEEMQTD